MMTNSTVKENYSYIVIYVAINEELWKSFEEIFACDHDT